MIKLLTPIVLFLVMTTASCSSQPTAAGSPNEPVSQETLSQINQYLERWSSESEPGVGVAISLEGKIIFSKGYGLSNLEYQLPITSDTVFHAASLSKQFTSFSILLLEEKGLLSLEDDIRKYLPQLPQYERPITIKNLLNHTSGLREHGTLLSLAGWRNDDVVTNNQIMNIVQQQKGLNFTSGTSYEYSNTGYFLAARIVEKVAGQPFHEFTRENIFEPLGMKQTQFYPDHAQLVPNRAYSYLSLGDSYEKGNLSFSTTGPTSLLTTSEDLLKWANNFQTKTIGSDQLFEKMHQRTTINGSDATFALGQELREYNALTTWSHGGRDAGYRSFLLRIPETEYTISILSNRSDFDTAQVAFEITDIIFKDHPSYRKEQTESWPTPTASELQAYTGNYELFSGLIFTISAEGTQLYFSGLRSTSKSPLKRIGKRKYLLNPGRNIAIEFSENGSYFNYVIGLHGSLPAKRIELEPFNPETVTLEDYEGRFFSEELDTIYDFQVENNQLLAKQLRLNPIALSPYQTDTFSTIGSNIEVEFIRDSGGNITGCYISGPLANKVLFRKMLQQ